MKKVLHFIWSIIEIIVIIYVICLTILLLSKNKFGFTQIGDYVITGIKAYDVNNIVDVKQGDLLIVKNTGELKKGDVIYYYAVFDEQYIISSDPILKAQKDAYSALYTLDDGYNTVINSDKVIGKYASIMRGWGTYFDFIQSKVGFLFFVLLPIMVVFIYQIYDFAIIIKYENSDYYHDDEDEEEENRKPEPVVKKNKFEFQKQNKENVENSENK